MEERYDPKTIEPKWQAEWERSQLYLTREDPAQPKFYVLEMFPYPSGAGLSVGHLHNYVPCDVIGRYKRMAGFNVLHAMGWDAFGLPAENEALLRQSHPSETVPRYAANFKRQLIISGCAYDWTREINSSSPEYYKWTQWFFLLLYKRGLAYRATGAQWWCDLCRTILANEQVVNGCCWRHPDNPVSKKDLEQWYIRITAFADALLDDLEKIDWPEPIKLMQRNWIGRSEGAELAFPVTGHPGKEVRFFTTRPDTVFGVSFMVLAPEHPLVAEITTPEQTAAVAKYVAQARRAERNRAALDREGKNRRVHRRIRAQRLHRQGHSDLDRGLRPDGIRHRRDHGGPGRGPARLRIRHQVRPRDSGGDRARRWEHGAEGSRLQRARHHGEFGLPQGDAHQ